jgi:hypothetical protein
MPHDADHAGKVQGPEHAGGAGRAGAGTPRHCARSAGRYVDRQDTATVGLSHLPSAGLCGSKSFALDLPGKFRHELDDLMEHGLNGPAAAQHHFQPLHDVIDRLPFCNDEPRFDGTTETVQKTPRSHR